MNYKQRQDILKTWEKLHDLTSDLFTYCNFKMEMSFHETRVVLQNGGWGFDPQLPSDVLCTSEPVYRPAEEGVLHQEDRYQLGCVELRCQSLRMQRICIEKKDTSRERPLAVSPSLHRVSTGRQSCGKASGYGLEAWEGGSDIAL
ncbi:hypothetical protein EYF80_055363 [Liparis tanakae]|uniref:Uncharacterized protein n=1 Tax=Liparis tanakae TaxID=230148 RepID=A0A4Z2F013_9TELE|nr:hypothetical protein EYF80_055363 [Liparis tanakae]